METQAEYLKRRVFWNINYHKKQILVFLIKSYQLTVAGPVVIGQGVMVLN